jgi:hypothetical protein
MVSWPTGKFQFLSYRDHSSYRPLLRSIKFMVGGGGGAGLCFGCCSLYRGRQTVLCSNTEVKVLAAIMFSCLLLRIR